MRRPADAPPCCRCLFIHTEYWPVHFFFRSRCFSPGKKKPTALVANVCLTLAAKQTERSSISDAVPAQPIGWDDILYSDAVPAQPIGRDGILVPGGCRWSRLVTALCFRIRAETETLPRAQHQHHRGSGVLLRWLRPSQPGCAERSRGLMCWMCCVQSLFVWRRCVCFVRYSPCFHFFLNY